MQFLGGLILLAAGFWAGTHFAATSPAASRAAATPPALAHEKSASSQTENLKPSSSASRAPASSAAAPADASENSKPVDLVAFLQSFSIADVHEACEFTRARFLDQTVAAHAKAVGELDNQADHRAYLESVGAKLAEGEKYWLGRGDLEVNGEKAYLQVIMDSHDFLTEDADNSTSCFRAYLTVHFSSDRPLNVSLDACTDALVTKNQTYYLNWQAFGDAVVGRKLAVLQIPLPESKTSDLEFMLSSDHSWLQATGFQWEPVSMEKALPMIESFDTGSSDPVASTDP